jgi:CheY-like chemotaxis protein
MAAGRKRILLVDDSRIVLRVEQMILSRGPYVLAMASDGSEALEKVEAVPPDLILMDLMMPRMDGLEAVRRLRANEATRLVPVIMVTTLGEVDSMEAGFLSGCSDYVTKPIEATLLLAKVRDHLGL